MYEDILSKEAIGFALDVAQYYGDSLWWGKEDENGCVQFCPVAAIMVYNGDEFWINSAGGVMPTLAYCSRWPAVLYEFSKKLGFSGTGEYLDRLPTGEVQRRIETFYATL